MTQNQHITWKQAFFASPGPQNSKEASLLILKGLMMGSADIIPGVSGGTIALITGIYESLIQAIRSFDIQPARMILKFQFKSALALTHLRFLFTLLTGILIAIIGLSRLMHFLLHTYPEQTWSLFFGLILSSIYFVGMKVEEWSIPSMLYLVGGTIFAYFIVGIIPINTPEQLWFIFLSGMIAICAMILPGISGAFILLILGKYAFITGILKNPFSIPHATIILTFVCGCGIGLLGFSHLVNYLLNKYFNFTIAFLAGLMIGSMRKIWPWKNILEVSTIRGNEHIVAYENIIPNHMNTELILSLCLMLLGFILVIIINHVSKTK